MNFIIRNIDQDIADKIENIIAEEYKEKSALQLYKEFEKKWNKLTEDYQKDIKVLNAKIEGRKIVGIRPFDEDRIDNDFRLSQDDEVNL